VAVESALLGLAVLVVLLPVNWYWGQRMAVPLVKLASLMEGIKSRPPERFATDSYEFKDELGRMFAAYNTMVDVLEEKSALERQVVSSDRLAAIGRLTAGIAHEINNPLLGMLTSIDTLKKLDTLDERSARAFGLVERGLLQIRDTVGALLVEARTRKRWLEARDLDDVRTLLQHEVTAQRVHFEFLADVPGRLPLPAGAVRQILMNLLHNAVRAAGVKEGGRVHATVSIIEADLEIRVINDGETLSDEQVEHLFEPFVSNHAGGNGLGLWVTYQLVSQLGGRINVDSDVQQVKFQVLLPIPADEKAA
jgi:signal transduction histidine kinase